MNARTLQYMLVGLVAVFLVLGSFFLFPLASHAPTASPQEKNDVETVSIEAGGGTIVAAVVRTREDLERGLSGRDSLALGTGMWFDFGSPDRWGIWMKDMRFPIDIVWFDENLSIVSIKISVAPETYPEAFYPSRPARFVLEISSGAVEKYRLEVGNQVLLR